MQKVESIIIGGRPCGLGAAVEQRRKGTDTLIIEKSNVVKSVYNYPTHQTSFSSSDKLGIGDVPLTVEESRPRRSQALVYYREVVKHHQLGVNAFEEVLTAKEMNNKFTITTTKDVCERRFLTIAIGYYGQHNTLEVEGTDLPKVFHYFKEAHPYSDRDVVITGSKSSAIDAVLELERVGANVAVLYRGGDCSPSVRPWILPNFTVLVNHERTDMEFNANVTQIAEDTVTYEINGENRTIHSDYVFTTIGYRPDCESLRSVDTQINTNEFGTASMYSGETYETNIENCYIADAIAAGNDANTIFTRNGKFHSGIIAQSMLTKKRTPLES